MALPSMGRVLRAVRKWIVPASTALLVSCGGGASNGDAAVDTLSVGTQKILSVDAAASTTWTLCATEGQSCAFSGQHDVRYGSATVFATQTLVGGTACSNAVFGDPLVGTVKSCWYSTSASTATDPSGWTLCATENGVCSFSGTQQVRYGTATQYFTQQITGQTACSNGVFGDPVVGTVKSCWYATGASTATNPSGWTVCATENGVCSFSGTQQVRYGTTTQYVTQQLTGQTACSNAVFGDPAIGTVKTCWVANASANPASPPPGATGTNYPVVLNASATAHAGDVVTLQGANFGSAPQVFLDGSPAAPLSIVNSVGTQWLAVQIPTTAQGALILRIANATGTSAQIKLNAAKPLHLDTLRLVPGGAFRVFGRNLMVAGSTPKVTVDGLVATVDASRSDEYMLTASAPTGLAATAASVVVVDNGNGSGAATLDRTITVGVGSSGDPFQLGVGWGADFVPIAATVINAASDPRLAARMVCDGQHDDSVAVQSAIDLAAAGGGGVVQLPSGSCRMASVMNLRSRVVVQGAGMAATQLVYESNYPVYGVNLDLTGMRNLTLTNKGTATEGPMLKDGTRLVLQNVRVQLTTSRQMYLTGNTQFVVAQCAFEQTGSISDQGPYLFTNSAGLVFENNTTSWMDGAPAFGQVHDSYIHANRFTRDGRYQNGGGVVHSLTMDFAHRIAIIGNTFDVSNGPITNTARNDGETLLTEGGGAQRTENLGTVASAGSTSLSDPNNFIQTDPFGYGAIPENYGVAIVDGKGAGQSRRVVAYSAPTMTVDRAWDIVPDSTSHYATFVWGLEKSLIKDNVLSQNPRGIWLYHTAIREVDVTSNTITEGGGIFLRSYQNLAQKYFMPNWNVRIVGNKISNTNGVWMSYVNAIFVNSDARAFGIAELGIEMRGNEITANVPNVSSQTEDYAGMEGYANMMRVENYSSYESATTPRLLGSILSGNRCTNCSVAVRVGTGAGGTTILGGILVNGGSALDDWATTSTSERSVGTVVR